MSMKILKNLLWSLMCLTLVVSCSDDAVDDKGNNPNNPTEVTKDSKIKLAKTEVSAGVAGGTYSIEYTITNPHQGTKVEVSAAEPWVYDFKTNTEGVIRFAVEENTGSEARSCLVTVEYRFADPVIFKVKQGARVDKGFTLENVTSNYFDFYIDVIPEDKTTPYIVMCAGPEYIVASDFKTGEDFYNDDVAYFAWLGQFYGQNAAAVMQDKAIVGDLRNKKVGQAAPGVTYTVYCYYIDYTTGALLSEVCLMPVTTAAPKQNDVEFEMKLELVDGCMASVDVTPIGYEGDYYFDVLPKVLVDSYLYDLVDLQGNRYLNSNEEVITYWWATAVGEMVANNNSTSGIIADFTCVGNNPDGTPKSHYDFELLAEVPYYLFAYTMEENGLCSSVPQIVPFTTGTVSPSDNVISVEVGKVTARTAKFNFTPSNDDYYVAGWEKASDWAKYGKNDAEIMEYLLHNLEYALLKGPEEVSVLDLEPETEYVVYAFGSRGGCATTSQIFSQRITTKSGGEGSVNIAFKDLGYFDCADVALFEGYEYMAGEFYSGKAVYPLEVVLTDAEGNVTEDHGDWFSVIYDWTGRTDIYDDKQCIDGLVWSIDTYGGMTASHSMTFLYYGGEFELTAVVLDMDGQFSKLYRKWISISYEGVNDNAETYVNWWNEYQASLPPIPGGDEEGDESGDEIIEDEVIETQSLVISNDDNKLFSKKFKAAKMSTTTIEASKEAPEVGAIVARSK